MPVEYNDNPTYLASPWSMLTKLPRLIFRLGFKSGLTTSLTLWRHGLLTHENVDAIMALPRPLFVNEATKGLARASLLAQAHLNTLLAHARPDPLSMIINQLAMANLLAPDDLTKLFQLEKPDAMAAVIFSLANTNLLTQDNLTLVEQHDNIDGLVLPMICLAKYDLLTNEMFRRILSHSHLESLFAAIGALIQSGLLTKQTLTVVMSANDIITMNATLCCLLQSNLLTQDYFDAVWFNQNRISLVFGISLLSTAEILTEDNLNLLLLHADLTMLTLGLMELSEANLLTTDNFNQLLRQEHAILTMDFAMNGIWGLIPPHVLTQDVFDELCALARGDDNEHQLNLYLARLIAQLPQAQALNDSQSTHTASVHRSVSQSATQLYQRYGHAIENDKLKTILNKIKSEINALQSNDIEKKHHDAAKRAFVRLTQDGYAFSDPTSNVSTQQLIALAWLAIHDEALRAGHLNDALAMFIEGLYEIQREYCLSEQGVDNGAERDLASCPGGTFNKIVEKLVGIHPDCEIIFITPRTVSAKLMQVVRAEAIDYLKTLAMPETSAGAKSFLKLMQKIKQAQDISPIWPAIKASVVNIMHEEFASVYEAKDINMQTLIASGHACALGQVDAIQTIFLSSKGYQRYQGLLLRVNSIFNLAKDDSHSDHNTPALEQHSGVPYGIK